MGKGEFLGEFEHLVLLAVARQDGDGYGVSLRHEIERRSGREVTVGSVYATLARLDEKGLVRSFEGRATARRGGRSRRHFQILPGGIRALERSRAMIESMWEGLDFGTTPDRA